MNQRNESDRWKEAFLTNEWASCSPIVCRKRDKMQHISTPQLGYWSEANALESTAGCVISERRSELCAASYILLWVGRVAKHVLVLAAAGRSISNLVSARKSMVSTKDILAQNVRRHKSDVGSYQLLPYTSIFIGSKILCMVEPEFWSLQDIYRSKNEALLL